MEEWQKSFIDKNLPDLLKLTKCNTSLLASLRSEGVLDDADIDGLARIGLSDHETTYELYRILKTRERGYLVLMKSLFSEKQTGAYSLLHMEYELKTRKKFDVTALEVGGICNENNELMIQSAELETTYQQKLIFQKNTITLNKLVPRLIPLCNIKGDFLHDLKEGKCPELLKNSVPDTPPHYVSRQISSSRCLSSRFLKAPGDNVYVISDIECFELAQLGVIGGARKSSTQLKNVTSSFIVLDLEEHYEEICDLAEHPVHLLSHREGHFIWIKSNRYSEYIQRFVEDSQQQPGLDQDKFLKERLLSGDPVCIADSPGMGKSMVLASLGEKIMNDFPTDVVRFITVKELIKKIGNNAILLEKLVEVIACGSSDHELGVKLVSEALISRETKSFLLLDGYDQPGKDKKKIAIEILKVLIQLPSTQLFVTTRFHELQSLEAVLGVAAVSLKPFCKKDQLDFLVNFWKPADSDSTSDITTKRLTTFAKVCLNNFENSVEQFDKVLTETPLQCKLLAEVHALQALQHARRGSHADEVKTVCSLFEVYQKFFEIGFNKLNGRHKNASVKAHMYFAIEEIFPELSSNFVQFCHELVTPDDITNLLYAPGILKKGSDGGRPQFVHKTFAQYLVAMFIAQFIISERQIYEPVAELLFKNVFKTTPVSELVLDATWFSGDAISEPSYTFNHSAMCYFLNSLLKNPSNEPQIFGIDNLINLVSSSIDNVPAISNLHNGNNDAILEINYNEIYIAAVASNSFKLAAFLEPMITPTNLPWHTLQLLVARQHENEPIHQINKLLRKANIIQDFMSRLPSPIHVAAQRGNYRMVVASMLEPQLVQQCHNLNWLLHLCVCGSNRDTKTVINGKIEIIKFLCMDQPNPYRKFLEDKVTRGTTPLLQKEVHVYLIKCLIEVGADVNAVTEDGECVLHTFLNGREDVTPSQYHAVLELLAPTNFELYMHRDNRGQTPEGIAIEKFDLLPETEELFSQKNNIQTTQTEQDHGTLLESAVRGGRAPQYIEKIKNQTDIHSDEIEKKLFSEAIKSANLGVIAYMIEKTPDLLNAVLDEDGNTPIHLAMSKNTHKFEKVQLILIEAGAELSAANKEGLTPIAHAFKRGKGLSYRVIQTVKSDVINGSANEYLEALLGSKTIKTWEWNNELVSVGKHFVDAGALLTRKPKAGTLWMAGKNRKSNIQIIAGNTDCTEQLLQKLDSYKALETKDLDIIRNAQPTSKARLLYSKLKKVPGSYERTMLSLIGCNQTNPFRMLKKWLQDPDFAVQPIDKQSETETLHEPGVSTITTLSNGKPKREIDWKRWAQFAAGVDSLVACISMLFCLIGFLNVLNASDFFRRIYESNEVFYEDKILGMMIFGLAILFLFGISTTIEAVTAVQLLVSAQLLDNSSYALSLGKFWCKMVVVTVAVSSLTMTIFHGIEAMIFNIFANIIRLCLVYIMVKFIKKLNKNEHSEDCP